MLNTLYFSGWLSLFFYKQIIHAMYNLFTLFELIRANKIEEYVMQAMRTKFSTDLRSISVCHVLFALMFL